MKNKHRKMNCVPASRKKNRACVRVSGLSEKFQQPISATIDPFSKINKLACVV